MDRWFRRGERVALREVWDGRVFYARPVTVVEDTPAVRGMINAAKHLLAVDKA